MCIRDRVYTAAISDDNEALCAARNKGIRCIERAYLVGEIMKRYGMPIAVSGTHGKTTTTSMLAHVLLSADADPTVTVGGELDAIGGNLRLGNSKYFLTEACESHRSFLRFFPKMGIILSADADHLDYFKDIGEIKETFCDFARLLPDDGCLIVSHDNKNALETSKCAKCKVVTFGINGGDVTAQNIKYDNYARYEFDVCVNGKTIEHIKLNVCGEHNVLNALAAFAAGYELGFDTDKMCIRDSALHACTRSE